MNFYLIEWKEQKIKTGVYLVEDNWDDFGFRTFFSLVYLDENKVEHHIGGIKIAKKGMKSGYVSSKIKEDFTRSFEELDETYFSLGQGVDYYENLKELPEEIVHEILRSLRDIAFDLNIYEEFSDETALETSLLRGTPRRTVTEQYNRIAHGGTVLAEYKIQYSCVNNSSGKIKIKVNPESVPPTNIHVLIGRNGVGKTKFLKDIIRNELGEDNNLTYQKKRTSDNFANVICVAFSVFDSFPETISNNEITYVHIGNNLLRSAGDELASHMNKIFIESLREVGLFPKKIKLWQESVEKLNYDDYMAEANLMEYIDKETGVVDYTQIEEKFENLSSGHKVILLTLTQLVEHIVEKTLIILDEPETHLHPPLLSSFIRVLSDILIAKNGIAIIATHTPIILQEVPSSCAWEMNRSGEEVSFININQKTFGTNINTLMREIFALESKKTGFHNFLNKKLIENDYDYENTIAEFEELSDEARGILKVLTILHQDEEI